MKENKMLGHLAHVGDTPYAHKIEVGILDVKRKKDWQDGLPAKSV
jgi:hypothetical protein